MTIKFEQPAHDVRNDSSLSTDKAVELLSQSGVVLKYGEVAMAVQIADFAKARFDVSQMPPDKRAAVMESVSRALEKAAPMILSGNFSRGVADTFYADLMLWEALKCVGGVQ